MKRTLKMIAVVAVLGIVAAACGGDNGGGGGTSASQSPGTDLSGGTLRMAMLGDVSAAFDPQKEYPPTFALGFASRSSARMKS